MMEKRRLQQRSNLHSLRTERSRRSERRTGEKVKGKASMPVKMIHLWGIYWNRKVPGVTTGGRKGRLTNSQFQPKQCNDFSCCLGDTCLFWKRMRSSRTRRSDIYRHSPNAHFVAELLCPQTPTNRQSIDFDAKVEKVRLRNNEGVTGKENLPVETLEDFIRECFSMEVGVDVIQVMASVDGCI